MSKGEGKDILSRLRPGEGPDLPPDEPAWADPGRFLTALEYLRTSGSFDWADDTLSGITDTVQSRGVVTEGQWRAVKKIAESRYKNYRLAEQDQCLDILD